MESGSSLNQSLMSCATLSMSVIFSRLPFSAFWRASLSAEALGGTRKMPSIRWPFCSHSKLRSDVSISGTPSSPKRTSCSGSPNLYFGWRRIMFLNEKPGPLSLRFALGDVDEMSSESFLLEPPELAAKACRFAGAMLSSTRCVATMGESAARGAALSIESCAAARAAAVPDAPLCASACLPLGAPCAPPPPAAAASAPARCALGSMLGGADWATGTPSARSGFCSSSSKCGSLRIRIHSRLSVSCSVKTYVLRLIACVLKR
mmetsp:Transcript_5166/g.11224  ORF Transcript_5166/g.11224 Transcript_5166/m.11224 type:complete len:262 (-) Transcript_5166:805-1590(-)